MLAASPRPGTDGKGTGRRKGIRVGASRRSSRAKREVRRRRKQAESRAHAAQVVQEAAIRRLDRQQRHRILAIICFTLAPIVFVGHILDHAGAFHILHPRGWEDLFLGYPTAAALVIVGLILLGT